MYSSNNNKNVEIYIHFYIQKYDNVKDLVMEQPFINTYINTSSQRHLHRSVYRSLERLWFGRRFYFFQKLLLHLRCTHAQMSLLPLANVNKTNPTKFALVIF